MKAYERALQIMQELGADGFLVNNMANIRYLSGYTNDTGCLLLTKNKCYLFTDFRFVFQAREEAKDFTVVTVEGGYAPVIAEYVKKEQVQTLAFEMQDITHEHFLLFERHIPAKLLPVKNELSRLRRIKTPDELAYLREAEHIGDLAFQEILPSLVPGATEIEIAAKLEFFMKMHGADGISFPAIVASGIHSSMPHAIPSEKKLEKGDFVTMDFGCTYHGYCSDMTRTVVIGKADEKQKEIYRIVLEAQLATLAKLKAGMTGKEVDSVARDIIAAAGYGECFGHSLGHSVGLEIHEMPVSSQKCSDVLEAGMLMTVEPGIYVEGFGGVRIEDMVIVTEDGCENLTFSPKELMEL